MPNFVTCIYLYTLYLNKSSTSSNGDIAFVDSEYNPFSSIQILIKINYYSWFRDFYLLLNYDTALMCFHFIVKILHFSHFRLLLPPIEVTLSVAKIVSHLDHTRVCLPWASQVSLKKRRKWRKMRQRIRYIRGVDIICGFYCNIFA